ncbi:MAG: DUF2752 domain-containing protein [Muribaculaceae bacterium]|nr:DUF2752 domain-containing protein [Muribaculaceae bacterium]
MKASISKGPVWVLVIAGVAALAVVYYVFDPSISHLFPKCAFHSLTGFQCPGCGSQRAIHALLHGDVAGAMGYNALLVVSLPLIALLSTMKWWKPHFPRVHQLLTSSVLATSSLIIICLWWLLRNLFNW